MMLKCQEANVTAGQGKKNGFLASGTPNSSSIKIDQASPKIIQRGEKVRCLLPQVMLRLKSTNLLRQNSQLLF